MTCLQVGTADERPKFDVEYDGWGTYFEDPNGEDGEEATTKITSTGRRRRASLNVSGGGARHRFQGRTMDYPQILAPYSNFLQCPTPQAWIDKARDPANLPLLLTDHMVCELQGRQTALLLGA